MEQEKRPWGNYRVLWSEGRFQVKRVELDPGLRLSLQKHFKRSEKWTVVAGKGLVTLGEKQIDALPGAVIDIPIGEAHRIHNTGKEPLVFIEVQFGDYLGEDDILRLQDDFSRV